MTKKTSSPWTKSYSYTRSRKTKLSKTVKVKGGLKPRRKK